ncbi:hypothetical protein KC360_g38 [Hortaea werneckii]|nr:hypothetical protein KC360_g38 [Hortaea werneckii]
MRYGTPALPIADSMTRERAADRNNTAKSLGFSMFPVIDWPQAKTVRRLKLLWWSAFVLLNDVLSRVEDSSRRTVILFQVDGHCVRPLFLHSSQVLDLGITKAINALIWVANNGSKEKPFCLTMRLMIALLSDESAIPKSLSRPIKPVIRSFISFAAFTVNVQTMIFHGRNCFRAMRYATRADTSIRSHGFTLSGIETMKKKVLIHCHKSLSSLYREAALLLEWVAPQKRDQHAPRN